MAKVLSFNVSKFDDVDTMILRDVTDGKQYPVLSEVEALDEIPGRGFPCPGDTFTFIDDAGDLVDVFQDNAAMTVQEVVE